jgi:transposase InsO family protein
MQTGVRKPIWVDIELARHKLSMEVDTGATYSVVGQTMVDKWDIPLEPSDMVLCTYGKEKIKANGRICATVKYKGQEFKNMNLLVVPGDKPALLGRDWMGRVKLDWQEIGETFRVESNSWAQKYPKLFESSMGKLDGYKAKIRIKEGAVPKFCKAAQVPYAVKDELGKEIDRQIEIGVLEKVDFAEWASRVVIVRKEDQSVRMCGDFKTTINPVIDIDQYPLPTPEDLFTKLSGGVKFTTLDLSHAYQQVELAEESKQCVVLNTHKGLFRYNRLTYGIASAPAIFQNVMESLLAGITHTGVYLDDLIITGRTEEEHDKNVNEVLYRLNKANLRLKLQKCEFSQEEVRYLGHKISATGISPLPEKVRALVNAPAPENVSELKSFLGMIQYYQRFLPNLSTKLEPLHELLRKPNDWVWTDRQQGVFKEIKVMLQKAPVLVHYDVNKPIVISCDASPYGVAGVLSHAVDDEHDQPVAFASRKLSPAEKNYSQLDKEGLAVVFAVKKFHKYVCGRPCIIYTDHRPLLGLLGEDKAIPQHASPRVQRWAIILAGYEYKLLYRKGSLNSNADCLSRLPLPDVPSYVPKPPEIKRVVEQVDATVSLSKMKIWTQRDPRLSKVFEYVMTGWPEWLREEQADLKPYFRRKSELSVEEGVLLWGNRVVVPEVGRQTILEELHETHPGMSRMKALARSYVFWPGLDSDIETMVKKCSACQVNRKDPPSAPLHPWEWPAKPWFRVHADFAGPFLGKTFLILVDASTKWIEVHVMAGMSSEATIEKMEISFATLGLPAYLVTDNAATFTSGEFQQFLRTNGIKHITSAPHHPASNGLAERAVQTFKSAMKKLSGGSTQSRVSKFLARYRVTPQSTTGTAPATLMFGRRVRCGLDRWKPDLSRKVLEKQSQQKYYHDMHAKERDIVEGDSVYYRDYSRAAGAKYSPGIVKQRTGPVSVEVEMPQGVFRKHQDQVFSRQPEEVSSEVFSRQPSSDVSSEESVVLPPTTEVSDPSSVPTGASAAAGVEPRRNPPRAARGKPPEKLNW